MASLEDGTLEIVDDVFLSADEIKAHFLLTLFGYLIQGNKSLKTLKNVLETWSKFMSKKIDVLTTINFNKAEAIQLIVNANLDEPIKQLLRTLIITIENDQFPAFRVYELATCIPVLENFVNGKKYNRAKLTVMLGGESVYVSCVNALNQRSTNQAALAQLP